MRKPICTILFIAVFINCFSQSENCENRQHPMPVLSDSLKQVYQANLVTAEKKYKTENSNPEHIIWYGRRTAYLGNYKEAIEIFTKGIEQFPVNPRFYRHRGHRYITMRCFEKAIADLQKAAELINNEIDEIEADGIPNAMNIPTSTLQTNIWYHLGLAHYLNGEYKPALTAFEKCMAISDNNDMMIAALNWLNITLRKMGKRKEADERLKMIANDMEIIENQDYYDILKMYKTGNESKLIAKIKNQETLSNATIGFALGNYYLLNGKKQQAKELFEKVLAGNQWASFGYIAAETELARLK